MGGGDHPLFNQCGKSSNRALELPLHGEPAPPVLLPFSAQMSKPPTAGFFALKTREYRCLISPESSPMRVRAHRVHRAAVRAPPALHPQRIGCAVKEPQYISVTP